MTSQPCSAPCWYGLEPDKSTLTELRATLQNLPFVDQTSIQEGKTTWQDDEHAIDIGWSCLPPKNNSCGGGARLSENRLKDLYLSINYTLTFSDTVLKLGPPGHVGYFAGFQLKCPISLVWVDRGISVYGELPKPCPPLKKAEKGLPLNPNIQVSRIIFSVPGVLQSQVTTSDTYVPWFGFSQDTFSFLDFVPGDVGMWLVILLTLVLLVVFAIQKRKWRSPAFSFVLAAVAVMGPTMQFQFSDVITPMCNAYFINVLLCGMVYTLISEGIRHRWPQRVEAIGETKDNVS